MKQQQAFRRVNLLMAAIAAVMGSAQGATALAQAEVEASRLAGTYKSRGHGGAKARRHSGVLAAKRARVKAKGRAQNRRNHKGRAGE